MYGPVFVFLFVFVSISHDGTGHGSGSVLRAGVYQLVVRDSSLSIIADHRPYPL
jgi:hypothetical protein